APGVQFTLEGVANDYVGKGLSGGEITIYPPKTAPYASESNSVVGNVALYGATSGQLYVRGMAGERFAVRNSGALAVVEGVGDHACEYMTGGKVVILGPTGKNFGAGMSGGVAYVYDPQDRLMVLCNPDVDNLVPLEAEDASFLKETLEDFIQKTESHLAQRLLDKWEETQRNFVKYIPEAYARALENLKSAAIAKEA
ncbi:MAG TPA: glutamate synthase subunit alpha, partial [Cytophagales bacterium]|nr:glutamate synthase subunit alpha [Cytophagales bacterium]